MVMDSSNNPHQARVGFLKSDSRQSTPPRDYKPSRNAAADVIRGQIDAIYSGNSGENTPHTTPVPVQPIPKHSQLQPTGTQPPQPAQDNHRQTHAMRTAPPKKEFNQPVTPKAADEQWNQYHSAWQKYYQMYYERYYAGHLYNKQQEMSKIIADNQAKIAATKNLKTEPTDEQLTAMKELRSQIQQKVRDSAKKVKKSRHFMPMVAGLAVLLIFSFLQYNRLLFGMVAAYTSPGNIEPQNIIVNASSDIAVPPDPRIIIPKINIDAPVVYGVASDKKSQLAAMEKGVAHFSIPGANALPGQVGNIVLAAHSSNDAFARGEYKFVFAQNEKLAKGDVIYLNYESKRYTYKITSMEVVLPTEVSKVQLKTNKPMLTLVSCVPIGTAEKRLLVFAEQISPDPAKATATTENTSSSSSTTNIPAAQSPTLLERLFGAN